MDFERRNAEARRNIIKLLEKQRQQRLKEVLATWGNYFKEHPPKVPEAPTST
jgi:hypothetical protein